MYSVNAFHIFCLLKYPEVLGDAEMSSEPEIREELLKKRQQMDTLNLSQAQGKGETRDKESSDRAFEESCHGSHNTINVLLAADSCNTENVKEHLTDLSEKYRTLYNNLRDGSAAVDLQGRIIECNSAFERMVGYCFDELRTITFEDITPKKWHAFERRILEEQVIKRGYSDLYEKEYQHKNGKIFPVELQTYAIYDNEKKLSGFWAIVRDISKRKEVEEELQQSEERFRFAISSITDILYEWNVESGIFQWLGDVDSLLGYENGAFPRTLDGFLKHLHPEDAAAVHAVSKKGLTEHQKWQGEYRVITKKGEMRYWYGTGIGVYNDEGKPLRVIGAVTDITKRKQAEIALEESRQMLCLIMDAIPVRVFWKDCNSKYLGCNKTFARDAGLRAPDEVIGKNDYDMGWVEQAELYRADDQRVIQSGQPKLNYIEPQTTPDGRRIWLRTSKIPLRDTKNNIIGVLGTYEDITQQKDMEDELRRSEERYRLVTENASDVIWTMDLNLRFTYFSPSNERLTGYKTEDALKLSLDQLLTPESVERALQSFTAEMEIEKTDEKDLCRSVTLELDQVKVDGTIFSSEVRMCFLRDSNGNPIAILGITRDITERKKAEASLRRSEEKFVKAFKLSPIAIAINRLSDGKFLNVNEAFIKLCGYDSVEIISHTPAELNLWNNPDDAKQIVDALHTSGFLNNHEYMFRTKAGNLIVTSYSAEIIEFGGEQCYLSVLMDITKQKNMEESLRESEEKYRSIVENTQDVIMLTNPDGRVEYLSPACSAVIGYHPDELIGTTPEIFYAGDLDKVHFAFLKALRGEPGTNFEYRILTKDGVVRWVSHSWAPILTKDKKLKYVVSVVRNIADSKLAEQNLRIKIEELEKYKSVTINREIKMVELKKEINALCKQLHQNPKYPGL
jgi:PAS domain S-box-containing protein